MIRRITRKIYFRLTLLFSVIFLTAFILFSVLTLTFLYRSFEEEDNVFLQRKILSYWASYQSRGETAFFDELYEESNISGDRPFLIRVADKENTTLFFNYPPAWEQYDVESLEEYPVKEFRKKVVFKSRHGEEAVEVFSTFFDDRLLVQVGISNARRLAILRGYEKNMVLLLGGLSILCLATSAVLASRALGPIKNLNRTLGNILNTGDLKARVELRGSGDDLDELMERFNLMLGRIETLLDRMKDTVNAVAHDLKTPITRMRGVAELALHPDVDEKTKTDALGDVLEASDEIVKMLNSIMDINEAETGILKLNKTKTDIIRIAEEVTEVYSFVAEEKNISVHIAKRVPELHVFADEVRLRQVIGNLLDNAIKYSPPGTEIRIESSVSCIGPVLAMQDQGPGIADEEKELIFSRLFRGSGSEGTKGTGLGLSLVKAVMEAHNGHVEVHTEGERGTRFVLQFPPFPVTHSSSS